MGKLLTKVIIGGITIRDDSDGNALKLLKGWEYERTGTNEISELTINAIKTIGNYLTLQVGQTVSIWKGFTTSTDTKVFEGFISEFEPDGGLIKITCKDKMWDLIRKNVNKVYEDTGPQAGQISAIAKDLIETYGLLTSDEVATGTGATETIAEFRCVHTDIFERLKALADAVRYQFWYDAINDTVHFEPSGYNDSATTLTVGTEIIGVPKWSSDTSRMVNDLRVDGAVSLTQIRKPQGTGYGTIGTTADFDTTDILLDKTPESVELIFDASTPPITVKTGGTKDASSGHFYYIDKENKKVMPAEGTSFATQNAIVNYTWYAPAPIHQINQSSIDTYGKFEDQRTISDIQTIADAEVRTAEILSRFSQPFLVGELLVKSNSAIDVNFGDTVTIVDNINEPNVNQSLVVTKQVIKYPGSNQELIVGDEAIRLADWQIDVEGRLKRIEESLSLSNQDLILELIDIQNSFDTEPRYRKILTRDTSADSIWGRDNWATAEWDDTYTESEIDNYIQQFENSYTEDFVDEDFESTNTTASWSTTGSVTFTSGQIAESESIDFNNGTITSVDIDVTIDSGSLLIEVSANGSSFETVTNNTTHNFSQTGTDLRFKLTENNTSTAEVSKVILSNYH